VDPLEAAIHINARPAGKKMRGMQLLSGGERALIAHLEASLNGFDRAAIHTIHSFCKKNLDTFAFENRVGLQSELVDKASIAEKAFYRLARGPWKEWLFDDKAALDRLLEETGTGSLAKLRAVVCSLATRISSHKRDRLLPPPGIANNLELHPAFSREVLAALAAEMGRVYEALVAAAGRHTAAPESHPFYLAYERLETTLGIAKRSVTTGKKKLASCIALTGLSGEVETLMAWCAAASLNARTIASILTPAKRPRKEVVEAVGRVNGCPVDTLIDACIRLVELIDEYRLWHEARHYANEHAASFGPLVRMVRELRDHMRELMRGADQISYDDMIELVSDALAEPDSPLLRALRRQYLYGIIDEFQDTNALQWDIFRTIFLDGNNTDSEQRNVLYVVGDPKQSIFSFQGADIFTYLRARDEIAARGGACRELPANYRSSPAMIAAHNALFGGAA
jgi:ATP-dependent exoDNAse (exonuclease V) beta subunit